VQLKPPPGPAMMNPAAGAAHERSMFCRFHPATAERGTSV
jgi:hypothetical protein